MRFLLIAVFGVFPASEKLSDVRILEFKTTVECVDAMNVAVALTQGDATFICYDTWAHEPKYERSLKR